MESIEQNQHNLSETSLPRNEKYSTWTEELLHCETHDTDWKQVFPCNLNESSRKNIYFSQKPVINSEKMGSDLILKLQEKLTNIQNQLENQSKKLKEAEEEKLILQEQLSHQSKFCTSLGAVLGNLLWHASNCPKVIGIWVTKFQLHSKLNEFLGAVNGTFSSFIKAYGGDDLSIDCDECQFIMSFLGITANISAIPEGRQFIVTCSTGEDLVKTLVDEFPYSKTPPRYALWRLILTILYNISVNAIGVQWLLDFQVANNVLNHCLEESIPSDLHLLCLSILHSVTCDLTDLKHLHEILQFVPLKKIHKISLSGEHQIVKIAKEIEKNLKKARNILHFDKLRLNN